MDQNFCCDPTIPLGFPGGSDGKESARNAEDPGLIPGSERSPGEGNGNPLQYSCLENPKERGAWQATVHGVTKSWTRLRTEWLTVSLLTIPFAFNYRKKKEEDIKTIGLSNWGSYLKSKSIKILSSTLNRMLDLALLRQEACFSYMRKKWGLVEHRVCPIVRRYHLGPRDLSVVYRFHFPVYLPCFSIILTR